MKRTITILTLLALMPIMTTGCGSKKKQFVKDKNGKLIGLEIPPEYDVRPAKDWKDENDNKQTKQK